MKRSRANKVFRQSKAIEGWFSREAMYMFAWLDEIQKTHGVSGDVFEIGCHHGKSAVLLGQMVSDKGEQFSVCDLFGEQGENVSRSGCGDRQTFQRNMHSAGVVPSVYQCNSTALTPDQIGGNYRLFHIDGGHNAAEALPDLHLAAKCLVPAGVILVDDPFRYDWPGVTEAVVDFLRQAPEFQPILVGCNKLALVRNEASEMYLAQIDSVSLQEEFGFGFPWRIKHLPFCGHQLRIVHVPEYRQEWSLTNLARQVYYRVRAMLPREETGANDMMPVADPGLRQ